MNYLYAKYKYSNKIKLLRMVAVIAVAIVCFTVGCVRIFGHNPDAGVGFRGFSWFVLIVVGILVVVVGYLEIYREIEIGKIYPVIALTLGIVYIALIPAFETPDEHTHFNTAYLISDEIIGNDYNPQISTDETGKTILIRDARYVDANFPDSSFPNRIDTSQYESFMNSFGTIDKSQDITVRAIWKTSSDGYYMYFLPAVGITIARVQGMNFSWVYAFGAMLNMLLYVAMTTYAINKMPFGKRVLFVISFLPITLQQASSFSYDCIVIACCMVVCAQAFFLKYGDRSTRRSWKWNIEIPVVRVSITELLMYVFCAFCLLNVKRGVYIIIFLLPIILCVNRNWFAGRKKYISILVISVIVVLAVLYIVFFGGYDRIVAFLWGVPQNIREVNGVSGVAPIEYIQNPSRLFSLLKNYIISEKTHIFNQLGGGVLGFYRIFITKKIVAFNLLLLLLSMIRYREENYVFSVGNRIFAFLIGLAPVVITFLAMLLYWTFPWDTKVEGFQGRYIIPTLQIMMLSFGGWKKIRIPNVDNLFIIFMTISSYVSCVSVLGFV